MTNFKIRILLPRWLKLKKIKVRKDYAYHGWEFQQFTSETVKSGKKSCWENENIDTTQQIQSQFEDVHSWLDTQDSELYKPSEEDAESDIEISEESFFSCVNPEDCSTMKREQMEVSYYSLQLRSKSKDVLEVVQTYNENQ